MNEFNTKNAKLLAKNWDIFGVNPPTSAYLFGDKKDIVVLEELGASLVSSNFWVGDLDDALSLAKELKIFFEEQLAQLPESIEEDTYKFYGFIGIWEMMEVNGKKRAVIASVLLPQIALGDQIDDESEDSDEIPESLKKASAKLVRVFTDWDDAEFESVASKIEEGVDKQIVFEILTNKVLQTEVAEMVEDDMESLGYIRGQ